MALWIKIGQNFGLALEIYVGEVNVSIEIFLNSLLCAAIPAGMIIFLVCNLNYIPKDKEDNK